MMIRILLAEDHLVLRAAQRALLDTEPDLEVVGEAGDTSAAFALACELHPDVIVLEIGLPGLRSFAALRQLSSALPTTHILLLTDYQDPCLVRDALVAGAAGCVISQEAGSTLIHAVRSVARGSLYVEPDMVRALLTDLPSQSAWVAAPMMLLTPRELDVFRLVACGWTNSQVARELALSIRAVECDRETIMVKLGLHSRADLVRYAALRHLTEALV